MVTTEANWRGAIRGITRRVHDLRPDLDWDDVESAAALGVAQARVEFDGRGRLVGHLRTVGFCRTIDELRVTQPRLRRRGNREFIGIKRPGDIAGAQRSELEDYLPRLSPIGRAMILMRFRDGLNQREIADVLGRSETYVSLAMKRMLAELKERLAKVYPDGATQ